MHCKIMKKIFFTAIILLTMNCKNENKTIVKRDKQENKIEVNSYLSVIVKAKIQENDKFQLYFSEEITGQYRPENIVEVEVKGENKFQNVTFNLPKYIYPIKMRIDLGVRKIETPVVIDEIIFSSGTNKKVFAGSELLEYFRPNKFIELDTVSQKYNRKSIDEVYDPFIISININHIVSNLF